MMFRAGGRAHAIDWAIALGLTGLAQFGIWFTPGFSAHGPPLLNALFGLAASLPFAWRRRAPLVSHVVIITSLTLWFVTLYDLAAQNQPDVFPWFLLSAYAVAAYGSRRQALIGAAVTTVSLLTIALPAIWGGLVPEGVYSWALYVLAFAFGRALRARHLAASVAEQRVTGLEIEREERARQAAEEERARIAREIHDVIAHDLSVIVVQAAAERRTLEPGQTPTAEVLGSIEQTARRSLTELRRLLGVVRRSDEAAERTPTPSLRDVDQLVERVERAGIAATVTVDGDPQQLPPGVDLCAYRVVQEALTNVLKHARASRVDVMLGYAPGRLRVEITDDGRGPTDPDGQGYGLVGMHERVALYHGDLSVGPRSQGGFRVRADLPFDVAEVT